MPVIDCSEYKPSPFFRNGHFATIYPALFRKLEKAKFTRQRIDTPDGDFLDIDLLLNDKHEKAVFLFHGLEGNTDSQYIQAAAKEMHQLGFDVIATNFRGCSGVPNLKLQTYHSGFTEDLRFVLESYSDKYTHTAVIGYSLGGNVSLKYAGEDPDTVHPKLSKLVAISVPMHLSDGSQMLNKRENYFYTQNFLRTLKEKMIEKDRQFPGQINMENIHKLKTIWDFDEYFSGPLNGFEGAEDYYAKSNALQFISEIKIEAHVISSLDDPFLTRTSFPFAEAEKSKNIYLHPSNYGGHVGFYQSGGEYWIESKLVDIFGDF